MCAAVVCHRSGGRLVPGIFSNAGCLIRKQKTSNMHVYIIGFMGVGKTTLGKKLAARLGMSFIDTDALVEAQSGKRITDLFGSEGEEAFRKLEAGVLRGINDHVPAVIATGGGLPCYYDNMAFMNEHGFTVYLKADPAFVFSRLRRAGQARPLIRNMNEGQLRDFIRQKMTEREPVYERCQWHFRLPAGTAETLVSSIVEAYRAFLSQAR